MQWFLLHISFFLWYIGQSVFGIWWFIMAITLFGFVWDIAFFKEFIFLGLFTGITSTLFTLITDQKNISRSLYKTVVARTFPWTVIGTFLVDLGDNTILLKWFALFLLIYALQSLFIKTMTFSTSAKRAITLVWGIIQWLFWSWGVFLAMANKQDFVDKSQFRSTFALIFLTLNIRRVIQFQYQWTFSFTEIRHYREILVIVAIAIFIWYLLHIRISNTRFHRGIALLMLLWWMRFLFL